MTTKSRTRTIGLTSRSSRLRVLCVMLVCGAALAGAGGSGETPAPKAPAPQAAAPQEVEVVGLVAHPETRQPTVVLQGKRDRRMFAMVIGPAEATGIALPLNNVTPPRPLTHDLFLTMFGRLNVTVKKAVITDLRNDTYYALVFLRVNGTEMQLDSRPSDAIALCIRAKAPVYVEERVFEKTEQALPRPGAGAPRI